MMGKLTVDRGLIEPFLRRAADCVRGNSIVLLPELNANTAGMLIDTSKTCSIDLAQYAGLDPYDQCAWIAFGQYLDAVYSHMCGGPNVDNLIDEYIGGSNIVPERRAEVVNFVAQQFHHALTAIRHAMHPMVSRMQDYGEEVYDIAVIPTHLPNLAMVVVETQPYD